MGIRRLSEHAVRIALGGFMTFAGVSHLSFAREEFQAQVPEWVPVSEDLVVLGSGVAEIALGVGMLALPRARRYTGLALAAFYVAIFPGNVSQYTEGVDAFGLDTDTKRLVRLFFQPVLVAAALYAGGWFSGRDAERDR
ncbi:hypothetical protein [Kytococcus sedentarius]|uniref:DoxX family protein n=1 Tax=Kytococcus sedentarius TaxID=1276 RepID=UPI0035BC3FCF